MIDARIFFWSASKNDWRTYDNIWEIETSQFDDYIMDV